MIPAQPTILDVAALAGVGSKTVSRVMNGEPNVTPSTTEKVLNAARALGYRPNPHAGNLRRSEKRPETIGLLVSSVSNPFAAALYRGVEDAAFERRIAVFASSVDDDPERERRLVEGLLRRRVDGLILTTITSSQAYLLSEQERGMPFVFVDREPVGVEADTVITDNAAGSRHATEHLLANGHRRLAYLGDRTIIQTASERRRGFQEAIAAAGIPTADSRVVEDLHDEDSARRAVLAMLTGDSPPTALFTSQNLVTIGAVRALRELGLQHEVALVGFDDFVLADLLEPAVTVVAQDAGRIGALAAERLLARIDGDDLPGKHYIVPTELIVRGSGEIRPR